MSTRSHIKSVATEWDWEKDMPPAPAIRAGNTLYLSGQIALGTDGNIVGAGDLITQARQCFENIKAILKREGATMLDVVKMTTYFTRPLTMELAKEYWHVRAEYFGDYRPASTGVAVSGLLLSTALIEIEVVAVLSG